MLLTAAAKKIGGWFRRAKEQVQAVAAPPRHASFRLPSEILTAILEYVDQPTLVAVALSGHALRFDAERLLYSNVFLSSVSQVHAFVRALGGPTNRHRSSAIRRLSIVYFTGKASKGSSSDPKGLSATKQILLNTPNLLHFNIWKPDRPRLRTRFRRAFRPPVKENAAYLLEARLAHDRDCESELDRSTRAFKASGTLAAGESADLLRTFLASTTPVPSLFIEVWYRSPEILTLITDHLPTLRALEIVDPDPYAFLVKARLPRRNPSYILGPVVEQLPALEKFNLTGGWMAKSAQSGLHMVNEWGQTCPSLRHVRLDLGVEWIRAKEGWHRQINKLAPTMIPL
ncbi:hypothetical protein BOTBODRAFT_53396 [Botryobasidium botryosum FD-172 SS1]|uniref:F-box domain-containing protein n=1 Tax=Botryobasidium botryosum (strain FD-172 SS1) TaxID=930990 RepID=A0A067MNY2_BOTB1|nr:hypothetical protein BOTBODRAFT_53396 [Botryobasidium botryosum FD-172 SS1]